MKIIEEKPTDQPVMQLKDGQIAIITQWNGSQSYIGRIVQRYDLSLVVLGAPYNESWIRFFSGSISGVENLRVRVLPPGTKLEL